MLVLALATGGNWLPAAALDIEYAGRPVKRDILALYDSKHEKEPQSTRIHVFAEMPLNWLGYKVTYLDVNGPLPPVAEMGRYRGLLTWFIEPMAAVETYVPWLDAVTAAGTRYAFLSELVPNEPPNLERLTTRILARLGLERTNQFVSVTTKAKLNVVDRDMVGFERPIDKVLPDFRVYTPIADKATVHLSVVAPLREGVLEAALVTTNAAGGYASDEYTLYHEPNSEKDVWVLNPFVFFKRAFGDERQPVPDVTTLMGRRLYFSHIDGDGWNNVSDIESYREQQVISAEVVRREVIEPYPDLPVSVGVIAGDALPELGGTLAGRDSARRLYALPQVEVASHTYSHPFTWSFFASYSRAEEEALIEKAANPTISITDQMRSVLFRAAGKTMTSDKSNKYIAGSSILPRTYLKEPFDLHKEVQDALTMSESLAPPGKKAMLYLWSGDTTPFEAAIAATRAAGVRNMNGGDSRLDKEYPSIFYVPPISRPVGRERQIFSGNSNENTYTNDWTGPFYGQLMLEETLKNTESPRRLKPFNLYYHMYSGERPGALAAVKHFVALARGANVIPVPASRYAAIADDFFGVEIEQVDPSTWAILRRGALQTVRFDDAQQLEVDFSRSSGVLGGARHNGSLYVSLDAAYAKAVVSLMPRGPTPTTRALPVLVESRWSLSGRIDTACGFEVQAQGFGRGDMTWASIPGRGFRITYERGGRVLSQEVRWADDKGLLHLDAEIDAIEPVALKVACHE